MVSILWMKSIILGGHNSQHLWGGGGGGGGGGPIKGGLKFLKVFQRLF